MSTIIALLLAFCLTVSPDAAWDCDYSSWQGYTCDDIDTNTGYPVDDSYYRGIVNHKAGTMTVYLTNGDSYTTYIATLKTR